MPFVFSNQMLDDDWNVLGTFSGHWPAVAAMIRLSEPEFRSLGGDKPEDLAVEAKIREARK